MKKLIVAIIALICVSLCAAKGVPSTQYLPPNFTGRQLTAPSQYQASSGHHRFYGVPSASHQVSQVHYAPQPAQQRYSGGGGGGHYGGAQVPILRNEFTQDVNRGTYNFGFETGNGIRREETGDFIGGWPHGSQSVKGSYSYTGDDGHVYTVHYTADENGFHAEGDHIPKVDQPAATGHGHGYDYASGGHQYQASASGHTPSVQYLPPQYQQKQQQKAGYRHHRRHLTL